MITLRKSGKSACNHNLNVDLSAVPSPEKAPGFIGFKRLRQGRCVIFRHYLPHSVTA